MLAIQMASFDRYGLGSNRLFLQIAFVVWLILMNCFYYLQFKALFLSRFAALKHR
jgi:hypothetical protein